MKKALCYLLLLCLIACGEASAHVRALMSKSDVMAKQQYEALIIKQLQLRGKDIPNEHTIEAIASTLADLALKEDKATAAMAKNQSVDDEALIKSMRSFVQELIDGINSQHTAAVADINDFSIFDQCKPPSPSPTPTPSPSPSSPSSSPSSTSSPSA
eukprot:CAMPEP_0197636696 /NCGR_PEP_ID=MMETSP1338-20131121/12120_1 /TAXON_ID=43686 ORGANISM="Pelagodinium beii, Strain RCC1491" /NCGR_SAMPLE_ID=MMETSP1338 /ASSEMBLY_ACC=CAM_ASM_000754 /LENGTH=156 /DNA_ID=CAMNT_0043208969 /DNA_START=35 /DNA_END=501 /DNA_ORIENTATION=+